MRIYFDNAATTQPYGELTEIFQRQLTDDWFNPSAMYPPAVRMEGELNKARRTLGEIINARPDEVYFNSGGSEGANTVWHTGYRRQGGRKLHFVTSAYEHSCVYECAKQIMQSGHDVDFIKPRKDGKIHPEDVAAKVRENTVLVSIMHVNNETGAINDVEEIARACKKVNPKLMFHSDGVQGFARYDINFDGSKIDYYTTSEHKLHALKGTGALFAKKGTPLKPFILGGGQESGMRSGTENTLGILAFAYSAGRFHRNKNAYMRRMSEVRNYIAQRIVEIEGAKVISPEDGAAHILNISMRGLRAEVVVHALEQHDIYIGTGSACSSKKTKGSRIHEALGLDKQTGEGAIRLSFNEKSSIAEADAFLVQVRNIHAKFAGFRRR